MASSREEFDPTGTPSSRHRAQVLGVHTRHMPLADDVGLEGLAARSVGWSGAQLAGLCREAGMEALRELAAQFEAEEAEEAASVADRSAPRSTSSSGSSSRRDRDKDTKPKPAREKEKEGHGRQFVVDLILVGLATLDKHVAKYLRRLRWIVETFFLVAQQWVAALLAACGRRPNRASSRRIVLHSVPRFGWAGGVWRVRVPGRPTHTQRSMLIESRTRGAEATKSRVVIRRAPWFEAPCPSLAGGGPRFRFRFRYR